MHSLRTLMTRSGKVWKGGCKMLCIRIDCTSRRAMMLFSSQPTHPRTMKVSHMAPQKAVLTSKTQVLITSFCRLVCLSRSMPFASRNLGKCNDKHPIEPQSLFGSSYICKAFLLRCVCITCQRLDDKPIPALLPSS